MILVWKWVYLEKSGVSRNAFLAYFQNLKAFVERVLNKSYIFLTFKIKSQHNNRSFKCYLSHSLVIHRNIYYILRFYIKLLLINLLVHNKFIMHTINKNTNTCLIACTKRNYCDCLNSSVWLRTKNIEKYRFHGSTGEIKLIPIWRTII